jgi:zinc protease
MKRLLTCFFGLSALLAQAQIASVAPPPSAVASTHAQALTRFTLANGMEVIIQPQRRAPTVVHMVWVRVGAMDEVDGTSGVAHALEHMMFKGTPTVAPGAFSRRVAELGGRENAFTARDYTGYYQQVPAARLREVMQLEADRFANNQWADAEFSREIEVVKEERRLRTDDNPRARLYEAMSAVTFLASPYRRPIVGWMNDLESMTADDVRAFHQRWYVPGNAAVVIAGDVDVAQVRQWAEQTYGTIPAAAVPVRKPRLEPEQAGVRRLDVKAQAQQAYVAMAFKVPSLGAADLQPGGTVSAEGADALALTVLAAVLDGYRGARLERALTQGADRVADSAGASNGLWGRGPQLFTLDGIPAQGKTTAQVDAALRAEVARIARDGISQAELARVKTQWVASEVYRLDSLFSQARALGANWALGFPLDAGQRLVAMLRQVSAAQVQAVAARYFGDDQLTVATLVPQPMDAGKPKARSSAAGLRH